MSWMEVVKSRHAWLDQQGPWSDVVISSRIRLARNLAGVPFPARSDRMSQLTVLEQIIDASNKAATLKNPQVIHVTGLKKIERQFLMERHLISAEMAFEASERGIVISEGQQLTLMINEEDHLRSQSFEAGLNLEAAWERADTLDTELGQRLPFAFDKEWGYCTRCPTNAGTGMRASCLLHLPALVINDDMGRVLEGLSRLGVTSRGFYGERSKAVGDLIQISNATSLGKSEKEIIESIERVVQSVIHYERQGREKLMEQKSRIVTEDDVFRSWGILLNARAISYDEAMELFSRVRLGIQLGLDVPVTRSVLNELMISTQPTHLQLMKGSTLKAEERDIVRAELIRSKLKTAAGDHERT